MFPDGNATPAEIIHALRFLEPSTSFRSEFAYDNLLYIVAGEVAARVAGTDFEALLEERLLAPLGMQDCASMADRAAPGAVVVTPHVLVDDRLEATTTRLGPSVTAAGGIVCSARGMANWASFILDGGVSPGGERLVSERQFRELTKPVTLLPTPGILSEHAGASMNAYALGWGVSTFYGEPMLSHGGGVWGVTTFIAVLPKQQLAVFVSNNLMSAAPRAVVNDIVDKFLGDETGETGKDWVSIIADAAGQRQAAGDEAVAEAWATRNAESSPSLPLEAYTGTYRDPWYGEVYISISDDGTLHFAASRNAPLEGPLVHFQYDTFVAEWTDRRLMADAYVTFTLGADGTAERIRMKAVSPTTDFSFDFHDLDLVRVPER